MPSSGHGCDRAAVRAGTVDAPGLDRGVHGHGGRPRDRWCRRPAGDVRAAAHVESVAARRGDRRRIHDRGVQPGDALPAAGYRRHRCACGPCVPRDPHMAPVAVASLALRCVRRARRRRAADPARWARLPAAGTAAAGDRLLHRDPRRVRVRDQCVRGAAVRGKRTTSRSTSATWMVGLLPLVLLLATGPLGIALVAITIGAGLVARSVPMASVIWGSRPFVWFGRIALGDRRVRLGRARAGHRRDPVTVLPTSFRGTCARSSRRARRAGVGASVARRRRGPGPTRGGRRRAASSVRSSRRSSSPRVACR